MNKKKITIIASVCALALILSVLIGFFVYTGDYYKADTKAIEAFANTDDTVSISILDDGSVAYIPKEAVAGFIFYPGGKVEHTAYEPLMRSLSAEGILCVIARMPFNLAVFDINCANSIKESFPHVESWYIGGHSLGGSMAAYHLADNSDSYEGLILLGSYSTADLSDAGLSVLSIYGSKDKVLDTDKYNEYMNNLPEDMTEVVIEGGCHAYFGMYGDQRGDGKPSISAEKQIEITCDHISQLILEKP